MSALDETAEKLLDRAARALPGAELEVNVSRLNQALTRFANSHIHQNVDEDSSSVTLRVHLSGRTASVGSSRTDDDGLVSLVERAVAAVRAAPPDPLWPGVSGRIELVGDGAATVDEATRDASPDERAQRVRDFVDAVGDAEAAGFCSTLYWSGAYRSSAGQSLAGAATSASMDGVARLVGADGVARRTSARLSDLDGAALGEKAGSQARAQANPVELPPGRYEVLLAPEAVADLLINFSFVGFNGLAHVEQRSFAELGEAQFDPSVGIYDDALDPYVGGLPFDHEGTPRRRVNFVDKGVTTAVAHDRRTAAQANASSTGHAAPGDASWGAIATNLGFTTGDREMAEMIAGMRRGLLVSDFWYTRVLEPKTMAITGLTRNGVWLVENGEIVSPVQNFRFTQAYPDALAPGRVLGIGSDAVPQPSRWGMGSYTSPALHLASWNFTGGASG